MFVLDSLLMTLIPEMGTTTDAGMMDGPAPTLSTQSRIIQPRPAGQRVHSRGSSIADENGENGGEKGKAPSPSQSSGMYVHV
jgi:hypothetical protein